VAQVVLNDVYKSYPARSAASVSALAMVEPGLSETASDAKTPKAPPKSTQKTQSQSVSILRQINLAIEDGEFMVLVGPSGCGKSTLLRLIAGLETLTAGKIWVGDRCVNDLPPKQRDIAMVFQSYALYPHMTIYNNLAFGLRRTQSLMDTANLQKSQWLELPAPLEAGLMAATRPLPKGLRYRSPRERAVDHRVRTIATMLQIEPLLDRLPKQLSGGQKQRVALGRAMARNPQVFLMDEPLSNLDAKLRAETRAQIVKLQRQLGTTTIYVTHDQTEAMTMGDRIAVMNAGQIQQLATPLELYNQPANRFVAEFIGSPPMNFLPVHVQGNTLTHPLFSLELPGSWSADLASYQGRSLTLGVRAEHFIEVSASQDRRPNQFPVQVELVEALGHETYLAVRLDQPDSDPDLASKLLQVRVNPDSGIKVGDHQLLTMQTEKIHLFDPDTGLNVSNAYHTPETLSIT
jgi:multiple sugar transport system ATP-binding protein